MFREMFYHHGLSLYLIEAISFEDPSLVLIEKLDYRLLYCLFLNLCLLESPPI